MAVFFQKRFEYGEDGFRELCDLSNFAAKLMPAFRGYNQALEVLALKAFNSGDVQVIIKPNTVICRGAITSPDFFEARSVVTLGDIHWLFSFGGEDPGLRQRALEKGWQEVEE